MKGFDGVFFSVVSLISCVLQFIQYHRNISERKTTHAQNYSDVHPILQRGTMMVPAQQSCNQAAGNNNKELGQAIETKARASDQRIELETRKQERAG